ncbi:MAG: LUD domain-containing protein [Rubrivivax sp.]|nr:LUD domain-containing protein [Rubrivivax sp.]
MSARDDILARVRRSPPAARPLPVWPAFAAPGTPTPAAFDEFAAALQRMGGKVADATAPADVAALVARLFPSARVIASAAPEMPGHRPLATLAHPRELDDVDVGVVRAAFGVAETGSVLLTERELVVEALGFLAQHLVVLLDPARVVATLHDAYLDAAFRDARYTILMTGPSATADIEGVLIHGAQGIRSLTVVPCAAGSSASSA